LSYQRYDFLVVAIRLVELPHPEQVGPREPGQPRVPPRQVAREAVDDTFTPRGRCELPCDVLADAPVEIDEGGIDRRHRFAARGPDHRGDLGKRYLI
jgi:hypothetical protein